MTHKRHDVGNNMASSQNKRTFHADIVDKHTRQSPKRGINTNTRKWTPTRIWALSTVNWYIEWSCRDRAAYQWDDAGESVGRTTTMNRKWRHRSTRPSPSQMATTTTLCLHLIDDHRLRSTRYLHSAVSPRIHSIQRTLVWLRRDTLSYSRWSKFSRLLPEWLFHSVYTVSSQWVEWNADCRDSRLGSPQSGGISLIAIGGHR